MVKIATPSSNFALADAPSAAATALTGVGESWWEDYAASVAVRLDDTGTAGICALRRGNGDYVALLADSTQKTGGGMRLVQARAGVETVLAQRPGGIAPGQWYRLGVRLNAGKLEGLLDGESVLQTPHRELRGGGIAVLIRGGGARFDDVLVQPSAEPLRSPRNEGSPEPDVPTTLGPEDHLTWANPAGAWTACPERPDRRASGRERV